jgi:hypothetical protein
MSVTYTLKRFFDNVADKSAAVLARYDEVNQDTPLGFLVAAGLIFGTYHGITKDEVVTPPPAKAEATAMIADPEKLAVREANGHIAKIATLQKSLDKAKIDFELLPPSEKPTKDYLALEKQINDLETEIKRQVRQFEILVFTSPQISEQDSITLARRYNLTSGIKLSFYDKNYSITGAHFQFKRECLLSSANDSFDSPQYKLKAIDLCMDRKESKPGREEFGQFLLDGGQAIALGGAGAMGISVLAGMGAAAQRRRKSIKPN